jgi:hypothetical protein
MDSRKLFGGVMAIALLAAALVGAVYAWSATQSVNDTSDVGANSITLNYTATGNLLGPDGATTEVATGDIDNTGDFDLKNDGGTVTINSVNQLPVAGTCDTGDFLGEVIVDNTSTFTPFNTGGDFHVNITTQSGAPADCQQDEVLYTVIIMVSNP